MLQEIRTAWGLEGLVPFENLSYHYVARAQRHSEPVVLKLGVPEPEFQCESDALRALEGAAIVRVLDWNPEAAALLLEDVQPGVPLEATWSEGVDDSHTAAIAQTMLRLWRVPSGPGFATLADWRKALVDPKGALPPGLVQFAVEVWIELERTQTLSPTLLHGDLHHGNVLECGDGVKAIDPMGVVGDPGFEVYALLHNPVGATLEQRLALWPSRIKRVASITGIPQSRLLAYGFVGSVLSCCWSAEGGGTAPSGSIEFARQLGGLVL